MKLYSAPKQRLAPATRVNTADGACITEDWKPLDLSWREAGQFTTMYEVGDKVVGPLGTGVVKAVGYSPMGNVYRVESVNSGTTSDYLEHELSPMREGEPVYASTFNAYDDLYGRIVKDMGGTFEPDLKPISTDKPIFGTGIRIDGKPGSERAILATELSPKHLQSYHHEWLPDMITHDAKFGSWFNEEDNHYYLDIGKSFDTALDAALACIDYVQDSYWDQQRANEGREGTVKILSLNRRDIRPGALKFLERHGVSAEDARARLAAARERWADHL